MLNLVDPAPDAAAGAPLDATPTDCSSPKRSSPDVARIAAIAARHAAEVDRDGRFPAEAVAAMREERLLGARVPAALGGLGMSMTELARVAQRLARACASSAMIFAMHHSQLACIFDHGLGDAWHRDLAREIARDQLLIASITSEEGVGGDMRSSRAAVDRVGERFTLAKQAPTISYGAHADLFLVTARCDPAVAPSDQCLVVVRRGDSRLERTAGWDTLGMRGTVSEGFAFAGTGAVAQIVPAAFADIAASTMVPVSHLLWGAAWTGIAIDAVTRARAYLRAQSRRLPGMPLPGAARLARATGLIETMQARLWRLLQAYDAAATGRGGGWPSGLALATTMNLLKQDLSEACLEAVLEAQMICGMAGYANGGEFSLARHLRDICSARIMISNDRIAPTTGALLLAQRADLGTL